MFGKARHPFCGCERVVELTGYVYQGDGDHFRRGQRENHLARRRPKVSIFTRDKWGYFPFILTLCSTPGASSSAKSAGTMLFSMAPAFAYEVLSAWLTHSPGTKYNAHKKRPSGQGAIPDRR